MANLTLDGIDDRVVDAIRDRAKANSRTVEAEVEDLLTQAIALPRRRAKKWEEVRRIAAMTPKDVRQTDSVIMLREDRDRS